MTPRLFQQRPAVGSVDTFTLMVLACLVSLCVSQQPAWAWSFHSKKAPAASSSTKLAAVSGSSALGGVEPPNLQQEATAQPLPAPSSEEKAVTVDIQSKKLEYDENKSVYIATGLVHVVISEQNAELIADRVIYDQVNEVLIADGHVRIIRNGEESQGRYARIDLTHKSALIDDATTKVDSVRIKAEHAFVNQDFVELANGKLIIKRDMLLNSFQRNARLRQPGVTVEDALRGTQTQVLRTGFQPHNLNSRRVINFADGDYLASQEEAGEDFVKYYEANGIALDPTQLPAAQDSPWDIRIKDIQIHQYPDKYQKVDYKWPKITYNDHTILKIPGIDIGMDQTSGRFDYLGPKFGYDPDLGGLNAGPGIDFRVGPGSFKLSPLLTYGPKIDRGSNGSFTSDTSGSIGAGIRAYYVDNKTQLEFGRASQNNYNMAYAERRIFDGRTRLIGSLNRTYVGGLLNGMERPAYSLQVADQRPLWLGNRFGLYSFASAGMFKDEFNPTNRTSFFINRPNTEPEQAGRFMSQLQLMNTKPLISIGDSVDIGVVGQMMNALYTTGDVYNVLRAGPTVNYHYKDRFLSQAYLSAATVNGDSPFVFDRFYLGNQSLSLNNAFRVNKYLMVGARQDLDLSRKNARDDLLVGSIVYLTAGPPDVKVNLGFDLIRQVLYFGVNFYPSTGSNELKFDHAEVFRSQPYFSPPVAPVTTPSAG